MHAFKTQESQLELQIADCRMSSAVRFSLEIRAEWRVVRPTWSVVLRRASGVLPGGLDHNFQRVLWFITEVRSLQDLRQQEDR